MTLDRVSCPECGAVLKSPGGFKSGESAFCPKCETSFTVGESAVDEEFAPPGTSAARADEPEWSYRNSTLRYAILGVLVCVMVVLGVMLYIKKRDEARQNDTDNADTPRAAATPPAETLPLPGEPAVAGAGGGRGGRGRAAVPVAPPPPLPNPGGGFGGPDINGGAKLSPAEAAKFKEHQQKIIGTWKADLGDGKTAELVYRDDGTFTDTLTTGGTPKTISGTWRADRLIAGNRGIRITRTVDGAPGSVNAEFQDDELLHDTQEPGSTGKFRKQ